MGCSERRANFSARRPTMNRKLTAMTIVELLVVIAIIGVLIGLLMPAVQSAREAARSAQCKSQLRQIGVATLRHCDAHGGEFPQWWHAGQQGSRSWLYTLAPYLESVDAIRICPSDPLADERLRAGAASYVINDYLAANVEGAARNLRQVDATHRTMLLFEAANDAKVDPKYEHAHAADWFSEFNVQNGYVLWAIQQELQIDRHQHCANYVFLDGHVETLAAAQVEQWVAAGYQFARPQ
ncbi:MAG: DUF1559 domain-containing protein [Pirellulales bacterium]|nr:DUF1559 domain-containing protein [Pirellulales bacterium]